MARKDKHPPKPEPTALAAREKALARLRKIEGQIRGLQRMLEEDRPCRDVLAQVSSVQEALVGVSKTLMRNQLRQCVCTLAGSHGGKETERVYDEMVDLLARHWR